jgi:DNA-binding NtrC family response regulator
VNDRATNGLRGQRILIVEDEYMIAADLAQWFEEAGAEVIGPAGSVKSALTLLTGNGFKLDAAVLDVNLHDEQVFAVADALSAAKVPFVFATGYDSHVIPASYAAVPRCEKPVDMTEIARLLGHAITP